MKKYVISVLAAGCLWGFMGFFTRTLAGIGVDSTGAILLRCAIAAMLFAATILLTDPRQFRVKPKDFWCFFGSGVCSLLFFTYCYFQAITLMSLSTAAILLYTAPSIVMVLSLFLFKEKITVRKLLALVLAFAGCCLVSGIGSGEKALTATGLLYGLGSGVGYALYSIFARFALDRGYTSNTVNFYSCLLASIGAGLIWGVSEPVGAMFSAWGNFGLCATAGLITCYLPYLLYTYGLTGLETGKASILASVEPVVATLVGILVFHESMTLMSAAGVLCVLLAVVLLNLKQKTPEPKV
ncbi:MAG: DMT family transporter [Butyricicoccus sp.]